jgi:hypothetical protein
MRVMTGCIAFSSNIFGCMDDDIELSLSAWAFMNPAQGMTMSLLEMVIFSQSLPRMWLISLQIGSTSF